MKILFHFLTLVLFFTSVHAEQTINHSDNWNQWRGPTRDGFVADGAPWPSTLSEKKLSLSWRQKIGKGYPGPITSDTLVFTVETKGKNEVVRAFDRSNGKQKWEAEWKGSMSVPFFAWKNGSWVRSTPVFDGENLYVGGMRDYLVCLDARSGKTKWKVDFMERHDSPLPAFGFVCSPLVYDGHLYVQAGSGFSKLERETGNSVWRTLIHKGDKYGSAFSSPVTATLCGVEQLVVQTRTDLTGVHPADGKVLWKKPVKAYRGMNILTPTLFEDSVLTSSYGGKSLLFDLAKKSEQFSISQNWENKQEGYMSSPIVIDGYCYLHLRKQRMTCIDMKSGETKWISSESFGKYMSMVTNGKEILALDEDGTLYRIEASPEKLIIQEKRTMSDSPSWAYLALSGNQIFVRELEAIACYSW
ncbi:MAG: PQQ-binding-like beta-propeller repeat protein [Opitutales bacterium]